MEAVRHEAEGREWLRLRDLRDILSKLLLSLTRAPCGSLGFDNRCDVPGIVVQRKVCETVPRRGVIALNRHFQTNVGAVAEIPAGGGQLGIDQLCASACFAQSHRASSRSSTGFPADVDRRATG